ncbi:MAG: asparagine synthase C-terminal domain-containing protein [Acidobacteriota bacterium]|nr:asparagine synthase C-terminal domain-containing protein [Acidobacteriota bacterium]
MAGAKHSVGLSGQALARLAGLAGDELQEHRGAHWKVWAGEPAERGWSGLIRGDDSRGFAVWGDRLNSSGPPPEGALAAGDPMALIAWCREGFARYCGALWTPERLFLWTDDDAGCPLFFTRSPAFASEAKVLLGLVPDSLAELPGADGGRPLPAVGESVFGGIEAVPAAGLVILEPVADAAASDAATTPWRVVEVQRHGAPLPAAEAVDLDAAAEVVARGLEAAVERLVGDAREVAVSLSGGVDSSAVAALAAQRVERLHTFTVGSPFGDEFEQAREVAEWLGSEHRELMMLPEDLESLLDELLWGLETWDPLTLQIAAPAAYLYRRVGSEHPLFVTGYGADLVFAGAVDTSLEEERLEALIRHQVELTVPTNEMAPAFARRSGVVVRYPYWVPEVKSLGLSLRARLKVREGEVKFVLRRAVERFLPPEVAWRRKVGIHQGSSMGALFAEVLGSDSMTGQAQILRRRFLALFERRMAPASGAPTVAAEAQFSEDSP